MHTHIYSHPRSHTHAHDLRDISNRTVWTVRCDKPTVQLKYGTRRSFQTILSVYVTATSTTAAAATVVAVVAVVDDDDDDDVKQWTTW